jgi:hypothetical protein
VRDAVQFEVFNDYGNRFRSTGTGRIGIDEKIPVAVRANANAIFVMWRPKIWTPHMYDVPFF